jgi:hypothetical protein
MMAAEEAAQHSPAAAFLFGHLIPLASGDNDTLQLPNSKLLSLPGAFGRAELLEPYAKKKCSYCRQMKKEKDTKKKPASAVIELCRVCQSIQSLAKFISRKDFLTFAYHGGSKQQNRPLVLTVSARNTAQLVRVSSPSLNYNKVIEQKIEDGMVSMVVNDGDIISICWYETGVDSASHKELKPLIQFRVVKCLEAANSVSSKDVAVQKSTEEESVRGGDLKVGSDFMRESHLYTNTHDKDEESSMIYYPNNDSSKNKEAIGSDDCDENGSQESSSEEEESAPLSLPSKFLASSSKSFSFDSQLHSASPPKDLLHAAADNCASLQKRKTPPQTGDAASSSFTTTKTPKKSNVKSPYHRGNYEAADKETIPLSSLTYDELLLLREQSNTSTTSLRHNVLSLALALTSNASAYDSNFLKEIKDFQTPAKKQAGNEGSVSKSIGSTNGEGAEANTRRWMPRLLQGTEIVMKKK